MTFWPDLLYHASDMKKNGTKKQRIKWARKGGKIGGRRRALALSPERRAEIARAGAAARWGKPAPEVPDVG